MRKKRFCVVLIGGGVTVGALVPIFNREREPSYGGKRLSEWVEGYATGKRSEERRVGKEDSARQAVGRMGTNAIPFLIKWMRYEMPKQPTCKSRLCGVITYIK